MTVLQSFQLHTENIAKLFDINELILDDFKLSSDDYLDSSKMINGAFVAFPKITEELGMMRVGGARILLRKTATQEDKFGVVKSRQRAQESAEQANRFFQKVFIINGSLQATLSGKLEDAKKLGDSALMLADEKC